MGPGARTIIIAQARVGSTRLPRKIFAELEGKTAVQRVLERASRSAAVDGIVVAIPDLPEDDELEVLVSGLGFPVIRGSSDDVLSRYCDAIRMTGAEVVVRVTCDCPLIDAGVIDRVVSAFFDGEAVDFCSNTLKRSYPLGMDTEVVSADALLLAEREATLAVEREHVTPFVYSHPDRFTLRNVEAPDWATRPEYRLTLDEPADLELLRTIYARLGDAPSLHDVIEMLDSAPELASVNRDVVHRHTGKPRVW